MKFLTSHSDLSDFGDIDTDATYVVIDSAISTCTGDEPIQPDTSGHELAADSQPGSNLKRPRRSPRGTQKLRT